ncbi:hypothetical protein SAMN04488125_11820 [Methylorubrum salsuginis]|uniref:Uncharacterized protein n=2 Tax=Methylorubrum salsuginis TaxID=414703 RepID=A0A1I4IQS5_9HYPH|nr:hypothetical protein SAMN04488125_11820 [Methylorubrum salsuginis]
MPTWPKDLLFRHGPELPMAKRIRRTQHNIHAIRASGCPVPTSAFIDTLDPAQIELWFADGAYRAHRLRSATTRLAALPEDDSTSQPPLS